MTVQGEIFGYELRLNLGLCDRAVITNPAELLSWAQRLAQKIGMTPYGEPWIEHFGPAGKVGWTVFFPITESNFTVHANDDSLSAFVNIFSCKIFDPELATDITATFFDTEACVVQDFTSRRIPTGKGN